MYDARDLIHCSEDGIRYLVSINKITKQKEGFGIAYEEEKCKFFEGYFMNDKKNGKGRSYIIKGPNKGHFYEGDFLNDKYHGEGRYKWPGTDEYVGSFKNGL